VLLPLSPSIGVVEAFKIIAVFGLFNRARAKHLSQLTKVQQHTVFGFFVMMASAAYLTRGLQLLIGSSKRSYAERADELSPNDEDIPLAAAPEDRSRDTSLSSPSSDFINLDASSAPQSPPQLRLQQHHYDNTSTQQSLLPLTAAPEPNGTTTTTTTTQPIRRQQQQQSPPPPCRSDIWAAIAKANIDLCTYAVLFLFVGLPIYYTTGYAMPAQLTANILCYFAALAIPARWRQYLHPVLVSSLLTVLLIWPLAAIKGDSLPQTLHEYKTGANYLRLWAHATGQDSSSSSNSAETLPGAGDVLSTVLDASIVSLALPMFQYRRELRDHFTSIIVPNVVISLASLLSYPPLCVKIGISAERSLAFSSRSLTLALATPATKNLGGDLHTVAALAIVSGIMGVLVGQRILVWLRIPEGEFYFFSFSFLR
jgi:putative effector of murein hydrolase